MKTEFAISKNFPIAPEMATEIVRFCIGEARPIAAKLNRNLPQRMIFKMTICNSYMRCGRATRNTGKILRGRVLLRVGNHAKTYLEKYLRYQHRADCPAMIIEGKLETLVHLAAHELGHAICGFRGDMTGEYQCERFAARCLNKWREQMQDPACMI
jgi:hypothetical protein